MNTRVEHDFLGELEISNDKYYGIQTLRALENFKITGDSLANYPLMINALAYVKKAAATANCELGVMDKKIADAICFACDEILTGKYHDQFVSDPIQGGAGTSVNMNANEVIANIALEKMGHKKGEYEFCHPNNHVNFSQSTNDAYPTAFHIALIKRLAFYEKALKELVDSFSRKGEEFKGVLKMGRTQLQDAVPMSLGSEFTAWANSLKVELKRLECSKKALYETNMGATAIGTCVNAPEGYPELVTKHLAKFTGEPLTLAHDLIEATSDTGAYVYLSGILKGTSIKISKICNDLRLLASGPRTGLSEINLPPMQPGSSIMPGKVNPVIPEVMNQIAFYVIGADTTITMAAEAGQLELNVMEPVIAYSLFNSIKFLTNGFDTLRLKAIDNITANADHTYDMVMNSAGIVTILNPILGYETAASIAKEALSLNKSIYDIVVKERKLITQEKWNQLYSFENLIHPKFMM